MAALKERIRRRRSPLTLDHIKAWSLVDEKTGCWNWQRAVSDNGYAVLREGTKTKRAHKRAFEMRSGLTVSKLLDVCHECDNRSCVNPDHLFVGSRKDNMADCARKGRIRVPMLSGEALTQSKLTANDVRLIRESTLSQRALAKALGVDRGTIACVRNGKTWRGV